MLKKQYVKSRKVAKVIFSLQKKELPQGVKVASVSLLGDFNDWDAEASPMKRDKSGAYKATLELEPGQEYQFRYLVNGEVWCNDWEADAYKPGEAGEDNSVVVAPAA